TAAKPEPARVTVSFGPLGPLRRIGVWLSFRRRGASAKDWILNTVVLVAVIAGGIFLTRFADGLRDTNPIVIPIGDGGLTGNGIQWLVSGFGVYVVFNWVQSLKPNEGRKSAGED